MPFLNLVEGLRTCRQRELGGKMKDRFILEGDTTLKACGGVSLPPVAAADSLGSKA
jgi:hypothetical protein